MRALSPLGFCLLTLACGSSDSTCAPEERFFVWADADGDRFGDPTQILEVCEIPEGFVSNSDDCNDADDQVNPWRNEVCNGVDDDCDGRTDERFLTTAYWPDEDGDGFGYSPGPLVWACAAPEGYAADNSDCDDTNPAINPDGAEVCNNIDDDCDGDVDDEDPSIEGGSLTTYYPDQDQDGYGDVNGPLNRCEAPPGMVDNAEDCADNNPDINPLAAEVCDTRDNDCDALVDDDDPDVDPATFNTFYADTDGDGFGDINSTDQACAAPPYYRSNSEDCDDTDPAVRGPSEWLFDGDGDGYGSGVVTMACTSPGTGWVPGDEVDCDDSDPYVSPGAPEVCNAFDDNCNGLADDGDPTLDPALATLWYLDLDNDSFGNPLSGVPACAQPPARVADSSDCDDFDNGINPNAAEQCNDGIDDDCNGLADDQDPGVLPASQTAFYEDADADGFGDSGTQVLACEPRLGVVTDNTDCDDSDPSILAPTTWVEDQDGDGVGAGPPSPQQCLPPGQAWVLEIGVADCDDSSSSVSPLKPEVCSDGVDQDCDGVDACTVLSDDFEYVGADMDPFVWRAPVGDAAYSTVAAFSGVQSILLGGGGGTIETLPINMTGCTNIAWSFLYRRGPVAPSPASTVTVSYFDGSIWRNATQLVGTGATDLAFGYASGVLSGATAANIDFAMRFSSNVTGGFDHYYIDELTIDCE